MSKRKKKKRKKKFQGSPYTPYTIEATTDERLVQPGLLPLIEVLVALKIKQQVDALFTAPVSNLGHSNSTIVNTFVLMLNEGAECLEDVDLLDFEKESLKLAGINQLPKADTLAKWLHHHGRGRSAANSPAQSRSDCQDLEVVESKASHFGYKHNCHFG